MAAFEAMPLNDVDKAALPFHLKELFVLDSNIARLEILQILVGSIAVAQRAGNTVQQTVQILAGRNWRPTENFIEQFSAEQLSDSELQRIWDAYDVNGDERMDRDELEFLMEDLCEVRVFYLGLRI